MTATFGKLEHETLTLQPGLNILEAPNEWGKSTWCAFLVNMLYGIDTRARTTGTALADKERYAPWSGSPMAGRIDLNWNGRDITIERRTKGRAVFGAFRAYETETGLDIPELNSTNCGQTLLGVERSVFTRAGFLKLSDLPVTQDESLRRRLNNLVTTGDESGAGDKLGQQLRDLKNKCRYNNKGLLPQAELEREQLRSQLSALGELGEKAQAIDKRQEELNSEIARLENHKAALKYEASLADARKVDAAAEAARQLQAKVTELEENCRALPTEAEARQALKAVTEAQEQWMAVQMESQLAPKKPKDPYIPERYQGINPEDAPEIVKADRDKLGAVRDTMERGRNWFKGAVIAGGIVMAIALALELFRVISATNMFLVWGIVAGVLFVASMVYAAFGDRCLKQRDKLLAKYPDISTENWLEDAQITVHIWREYQQKLQDYEASLEDIQNRQRNAQDHLNELTAGKTVAEYQDHWNGILSVWSDLANTRRDLQSAEAHVQTLQAMAKTVEPPQAPDALSYSPEETEARLQNARMEQQQLHRNLGMVQGQTEALGHRSQLEARLETLNRRIARLEDANSALEMAQDALRQATNTLQRRFAPRISKRAQELFGKLTGGRYRRIALSEDLSLNASAENEDTLRSSQWRSDGTVDQLYLALRLAVAEELTPEAPLVLDDAMVRFDDERLKVAMQILKEEAKKRQILLFTCQSREKQLEG